MSSPVDEYLDGLGDQERAALAHVRDLVLEEVPEAEPGTSYGLTAFRYRRKPLLGFQAASGHLAIYPSPKSIDAVRDRLTGFAVSKGTIRFSQSRPIPDEIVCDVIRSRAAEIAGA